ncbi:MAG: BBE domain-containing protein, partial [Rhodothermales bacterium]|nr:BBE domain-containing protein [Rhodothermales bacterium]
EQAADLLRWYRDYMPEAPRDAYAFYAFLKVPPVEAFPAELHTRTMCGLVWCHLGSAEEAEAAFQQARAVHQPAFEHVGPMPFPMLNSLFDVFYPSGLQWYWKGDFYDEIGDEAVALHVEHGERLPTLLSTMHLYPVDGAVHDVDADATAFSYRDALWSGVYVGVDPDPGMRDPITRWTRGYWEALHPHSMGGSYINFLMDEGEERIRATYRGNYDRLAAVKERYDPGNLFHVNQNVRPAHGAAT